MYCYSTSEHTLCYLRRRYYNICRYRYRFQDISSSDLCRILWEQRPSAVQRANTLFVFYRKYNCRYQYRFQDISSSDPSRTSWVQRHTATQQANMPVVFYGEIITTVVDTSTEFRTYHHLTLLVHLGCKDVLLLNKQTCLLFSTEKLLQQL